MTLRRHYTPDLAEPPYKRFCQIRIQNIWNPGSYGVCSEFSTNKSFSWDLVKKVNLDLSKAVKINVLSIK